MFCASSWHLLKHKIVSAEKMLDGKCSKTWACDLSPEEMLLRLRKADAGFGSGSPERLLLLRMAEAGFGSGSPERLLLLRLEDDDCGGAG